MENKTGKISSLCSMAKIGIITFHCANNYGAVLQTYGMQEYLRRQGHETYVIDYRPKYIVEMYAKFSIWHWISRNPWKCIKRLFIESKIKLIRIKRWNAFENFRTTCFNLYPYHKKNDFSEFDFIILGSDQIWNSEMVGGKMDGVYWGEGLKCNVFAYAVSSRKFDYTSMELSYIKERLSKLSSIGVREESLKKYIQPLCSMEINVVLDPSLLAGPEIYKKIAQKPKETNYLLIYEIGRHEKTRKIAYFIADKLKLKIVELVNNPIQSEPYLNQVASPAEFVGYIINASFVVTTSFHGTVFSFMFRRNFFAIRQNTSADDRIESFVNIMDVKSQFISSIEDVNSYNQNINYVLVWDNYKLYRKKSMDFIFSSIYAKN